ncbi:hypothetical protein T05_15782 [Trichinella murrelli]|uniref:Uncharacterized protein n=1 Tax=Trichinella murrelli TaxID=144512 RepID=A0A0V0TW10_9BILA|nr:hypothetical protein T05_15782 [Trichinella murrelli]
MLTAAFSGSDIFSRPFSRTLIKLTNQQQRLMVIGAKWNWQPRHESSSPDWNNLPPVCRTVDQQAALYLEKTKKAVHQ